MSYGLLAEFRTPEELKQAAQTAYDAGYRRMDAYAPFPVDGLPDAVGLKSDRVALIALAGGLFGGIGGFFMQWYANVVDYPINIAGHPYNSWPAFIPVTFELTVLSSAFATLIGMLVLNRLPKPYHPVFEVDVFLRASTDRFFLVIETKDPLFTKPGTHLFLQTLAPESIVEVPGE